MSILNIVLGEAFNRQKEMREISRRKEMSEQAKGLLGGVVTTEGSMRSAEFDEQGNEINVQETVQEPRREGYGLLGTRGTAEDKVRFKMDLLGLGYQPAEVESMLKPYDDKAIADLRSGNFKDKQSELSAYKVVSDLYEKKVSDYRPALEQYKSVTNLVQERGGWNDMTAQDDLAMITSLSKMLRPGEAVMSDDVQNALKSMGLDEFITGWADATGGKGMSPTTREKLYATMTSKYGDLAQGYQQVRQQGEQVFQSSGFSADLPSPLRESLLIDVPQFAPATPSKLETATDAITGGVSGLVDKGVQAWDNTFGGGQQTPMNEKPTLSPAQAELQRRKQQSGR